MSRPLASPDSLRRDAHILVRRASDYENRVEALVAAAETDVRNAEAALSRAFDVTGTSIDQLRHLFAVEWRRQVDRAAIVRELRVGAHEQYVAARRLQTRLDADQRTDGQRHEGRNNGVLVVDDYGEVCEALAMVLQDAGFVVRTAANGLEALLAAHEMRPAVILMDVTMPVLDGIEATRLIKATEATRHARVIACTANVLRNEDPAHKLFAAVLQKPTTPQVVLATVEHVASL
jgi:CheY-like chemotaxis protein